MIQSKVSFSGADVDASSLLFEHSGRRIKSPYPSSYTRVDFKSPKYALSNLSAIDDWIGQTIAGKWGSYLLDDLMTVVLFFELDSDAVLFKLLEGEKHCIDAALAG
jgi:hypothetical protein